MANQNRFRSRLMICMAGVNPQLNTHTLFDVAHRESTASPIDQFLTNLQSINKLAPSPTAFDSYQGQLVLLGVVAAVESFVRTLFRKIIAIDPTSQEAVYHQEVSYGAALHLSDELMPEALLERFSFAGRVGIVNAIKVLLAIKGDLPPELDRAIDDYSRVCQMRHCAVHRFGKLGVRSALSLGLTAHYTMLEKPLKLDYVALQNTIAISTGFVKTLNNFLFNEVLSRVDATKWTGDYSKDRAHFLKYYELFSDKTSSAKSAAPKGFYVQLQKELTSWNAKQKRT